MNLDYSKSVDRHLKKLFPHKSNKWLTYARHRVCRFIRNFENDNYGVVIGDKPVSAGQYTNDDVIIVGNVKIHISVLVN